MERTYLRRSAYAAPPVALALIATGLFGSSNTSSPKFQGAENYPANTQHCESAKFDPAKALVEAMVRVQEVSTSRTVLTQTEANTSAGQFIREGGCGYTFAGTFVRIGGVTCEAYGVTSIPSRDYGFACSADVVATASEVVHCDTNPVLPANSVFCIAPKPSAS